MAYSRQFISVALLCTLSVVYAGGRSAGGSGSAGYGGSAGGGGGGYGGGGHGGGGSSGGSSGGYGQQQSYPPRPYAFDYKVNDHYSGADFGQQESSDGNKVTGQYRVLLPDGRTQIVTYNADWQNGFNADVKYQGEARFPQPSGGYGGSGGHQQPQSGYQAQAPQTGYGK